jgi:hypothetical protein
MWNEYSCYLIYLVESPFRHIFQEQITDLTLVYRNDIGTSAKHKQYPTNVLEHILRLVQSLKHLSITDLPLFYSSSLTICYSCTLSTLNVCVNRFEDCLALLDGRFKQLTTFIVSIDTHNYRISKNYNKVNWYFISFLMKRLLFTIILGSSAELEMLFFELLVCNKEIWYSSFTSSSSYVESWRINSGYYEQRSNDICWWYPDSWWNSCSHTTT